MNTIDRLRLADPAAAIPDYDQAETSLLLTRARRPGARGRRIALLAVAACLALVFAMMPVWWPRTGATARASDLLDRASVAAYDPRRGRISTGGSPPARSAATSSARAAGATRTPSLCCAG